MLENNYKHQILHTKGMARKNKFTLESILTQSTYGQRLKYLKGEKPEMVV
jgi:hypothetical protein